MTITHEPSDLVTDDAAQQSCDAGACTRARFALDRRGLLRGAAAAGTAVVAGAGLSACGHILDPNENAADGAPPSGAAATTDMTAPPATGSAAAKPMSDGGMDASKMPDQTMKTTAAMPTGTKLGKASQIPVGGGMVFADHKVVVTQPKAGTYKAFSSVCTQAGCQCNEVASGMINCPCHGASFSISDGSALQGPTQTPLPAKNVMVTDGQIYLQA
ncbi:MAG TPA: Rieske (2Fe-2S) protein [Actinocrinis sp.]|nr:Rieske (2Fe-2S) protein [Actinocrinis sp.]